MAQELDLNRTPLIFEARSRRRHKTRATKRRAIDVLRARLKRYGGKDQGRLPPSFSVDQRGVGMSPAIPRLGLVMASPMGPVGVGGIMRHS